MRGVPLKPNEAKFVVVKKVPVVDCRVVRGFLGTVVDGSIYSWDYRGRTREYPNTASDGVVYSYKNNDGLHITLGDDKGFDMVMLRGGAETRMYADTTGVAEPADGKLLWKFQNTRPKGALLHLVHRPSRHRAEGLAMADLETKNRRHPRLGHQLLDQLRRLSRPRPSTEPIRRPYGLG